jgi:hypothetical protein
MTTKSGIPYNRADAGPIERTIAAHLRRALVTLRADMDRVEFWLAALEGSRRPLPDYESRYRRTRIAAEDIRLS